MEEAKADDDQGDDDDTPPTASKPDASTGKIDSGAPRRDGGGSTTTPKIDAGTTKMDGGVVVPTPDDGDGSTPQDDASTGPNVPSGPRTLPTPDLKGPYEVVKLENVGVGFENPPTAANDRGDGAGCTSFVESFGETPEAARDYALFGPDYKVDLYTLYYPKDMAEGELYPVLTWANGTCAKVIGYEALLSHLTSHGFIVIATNSRYTGNGRFQLRALDYVFSENDKPESPLYKHVDKTKIGAFGHSQGGGSTWAAAMDARIKTSVILNAGGSGTRSTPSYFVTGDKDIIPEASFSGARAQTAAAAIRLHKIEGGNLAGHITLMKEPERVYPSVAAWFRYQLLGDEVGRSWFVGDDCKLCNQPEEWTYFAKGLK